MNICIRNRPLAKITNVLRKTIHFGDTVTSMPHRPHLWQNSWGKRPYLKESISVGSSDPTGAEGMGMPRRNRSSLWDYPWGVPFTLLSARLLPNLSPASRGVSQGQSFCGSHRGLSWGSTSLFLRPFSPSPAALPLVRLQRCRGRSTLLCGTWKASRISLRCPAPNPNRDPGIVPGIPVDAPTPF